MGMYIIAEPCIGTKDTACVDVCPVDCIHPRKDEPEFEQATMLYIHPEECIDCGACEPECSVEAIRVEDQLPADWAPYTTGRWIWDPRFGWSWVDVAPWGWAPYHYGRWVHLGAVWAWAPGPVVVRPVYAPALVAFFGSTSSSTPSL